MNTFNALPMNRAAVPLFSLEDFSQKVIKGAEQGERLLALWVLPHNYFTIYAALGQANTGGISVFCAPLDKMTYPSLTPWCAQAHWFEREIAEQWAIIPEGHPWLKPIRFHRAYNHPRDAWGRLGKDIEPGLADYYQVTGDEVHEVAVGPVHAGIIEPGHFRFQCCGETVLHLEISLGYQHRGLERRLAGLPFRHRLAFVETLAGDTSIGHGLAYCQAVEALAGISAPFKGQEIRAIALELERLANHVGDLGALAGDVGYLPTASFCGRLRGDLLNLSALVCGNRFGRSWLAVGGVAFDITPEQAKNMLDKIHNIEQDIKGAVELLWHTPSVMTRFELTGKLSRQAATDLGMVGVAARACGLLRDVRFEYPFDIYRFFNMPMSSWSSGDVFGRAYVRWGEIIHSLEFIKQRLRGLSLGPARLACGPLKAGQVVVSLVEGWRGEVCHIIFTDERGEISDYKVVDPSFHNWAGLAYAMRGQQISDFPLCNKSFNLSYCGHDL